MVLVGVVLWKEVTHNNNIASWYRVCTLLKCITTAKGWSLCIGHVLPLCDWDQHIDNDAQDRLILVRNVP